MDSSATDSRRSALTADGNRIVGFEAPSDWPLTQGAIPAPVSSTTRTQGSFSLAIKAKNFVVVKSASFSVGADIAGPFTYDLFLPAQQPNPHWFGATQLYVDCPSKSIFNAFIGQKELTGLATNRFHAISIPLPAAIATQLKGGCGDFAVSISLNVPFNATGTYLLDNLRFTGSGNRVTPTLNCVATVDGTTYTAFFGYRNLENQVATIPIGPSNTFSPAPANRGQPTVFQAGTIPSAASADFVKGQNITWRLTSGSATANAQSPVCPGSTPTVVTCADAQRQSAEGCATLILIPNTHGPNQDPAVLGQPATEPVSPGMEPGDFEHGENENEASVGTTNWQPVVTFLLAPTQTRVFNFSVTAGAIITATARWHTTGRASLVLVTGGTTTNGAFTDRGVVGGLVTAFFRAGAAGPAQVQVQNTGSTTITIKVVIGSTPVP